MYGKRNPFLFIFSTVFFFFFFFLSMDVSGMGFIDQNISSLIFTENLWITVVFALFCVCIRRSL